MSLPKDPDEVVLAREADELRNICDRAVGVQQKLGGTTQPELEQDLVGRPAQNFLEPGYVEAQGQEASTNGVTANGNVNGSRSG